MNSFPHFPYNGPLQPPHGPYCPPASPHFLTPLTHAAPTCHPLPNTKPSDTLFRFTLPDQRQPSWPLTYLNFWATEHHGLPPPSYISLTLLSSTRSIAALSANGPWPGPDIAYDLTEAPYPAERPQQFRRISKTSLSTALAVTVMPSLVGVQSSHPCP